MTFARLLKITSAKEILHGDVCNMSSEVYKSIMGVSTRWRSCCKKMNVQYKY